jgi:hypothetical protein
VAVLESVQDLIAARIDRLDDGPKELLQTASVIARWMTWRYATHCYASLGDLALSRGDLSRANGFADESLAIAVPTHSRKYESRAWQLKGRCAVLRRSWDDAEVALARALAIATEIPEPRQMWQTHAAIGALHAARHRTGEAEQSLLAASDILDRVRSTVRHPGLAAGLARVQAGLGAGRG